MSQSKINSLNYSRELIERMTSSEIQMTIEMLRNGTQSLNKLLIDEDVIAIIILLIKDCSVCRNERV